MNIFLNILAAVQILSALAMIGLILVQHGKGADMGASFGGGASGSLFGATGSANFLSRSTAVCAAVFFGCTLTLAFNPGAAGSRNATLEVTSTGTNPPTLTLTGTATAPAAPVATLSAATLHFSATPDAAASPQPLSIQNSGNAVLTVAGMQIASGSFTLDPAPSNGCSAPPFDLLPGQSCAMSIGWSSSSPAMSSANRLAAP